MHVFFVEIKMLQTRLKFPLATTPQSCPAPQGLSTVTAVAGPLWTSFYALRLCMCSFLSPLQKDRRRWAPQTRKVATSPRAAMGPRHLEHDLARGGWKSDAPWTESPGTGPAAFPLSNVFQASQARLKGSPRGSRGPYPGKALCPHPQAPRSHHLLTCPGTLSRHCNHRMLCVQQVLGLGGWVLPPG